MGCHHGKKYFDRTKQNHLGIMGGQSFAIIFGNKKNMKFGFKVCRIWPLNSIAMAGKFGPNEVSL
jgi:hypothetical protein